MSSADSLVGQEPRRFSRQALTRPRWVAGSPLVIRAYALAAEAYRGQRRASDEAPLLAHAIEVAELLRAAGRDQNLVAAGLLHDGVERGSVTEKRLHSEMGDTVTDLVLTLTEDSSISSVAERKRALLGQVIAAGDRAVALFAADTLSTVRALRLGLDAGRVALEERLGTSVDAAITGYRDSVAMIEHVAPDSEFLGRSRSELRGMPVSIPAVV
jgi:(p)ppGpp synthase/HD superfamily hydrolase